jgi:hypothetical protein
MGSRLPGKTAASPSQTAQRAPTSPATPHRPPARQPTTPPPQVSLVLEYCDWGCLRDALDAGAFYTGARAGAGAPGMPLRAAAGLPCLV